MRVTTAITMAQAAIALEPRRVATSDVAALRSLRGERERIRRSFAEMTARRKDARTLRSAVVLQFRQGLGSELQLCNICLNREVSHWPPDSESGFDVCAEFIPDPWKFLSICIRHLAVAKELSCQYKVNHDVLLNIVIEEGEELIAALEFLIADAGDLNH